MPKRLISIDTDTGELPDALNSVLAAEYGTQGREIVGASRLSQFTWSGGDWVDVEGLEVLLSTEERPAYLEANLGLLLAQNGPTTAGFYARILDTSTNRAVAPGIAVAPGTPGAAADSFNFGAYAPFKGRIPAGRSERRYIVQVQSLSGVLAYIVPDWYLDAVASLTAFGA